MGIKRHKPEEIVTKLWQVEVLCGQGMPRVDAIRQVQIADVGYTLADCPVSWGHFR